MIMMVMMVVLLVTMMMMGGTLRGVILMLKLNSSCSGACLAYHNR